MELMTDPSYYPNVIWYIWPKITGGDRKIPWISVQDVGAIAAKAFAHPTEFMGKDFILSADAQSLDEYPRHLQGSERQISFSLSDANVSV